MLTLLGTGIIAEEVVEDMPKELVALASRLVRWGILPKYVLCLTLDHTLLPAKAIVRHLAQVSLLNKDSQVWIVGLLCAQWPVRHVHSGNEP